MSNLILFGFPRCGKTTLGKELARMLGKPFVDTDERIKEAYGSSPQELCQHHGEDFFRTAEEKVICSIQPTHAIIAAGGGSILRSTNRMHLFSLGHLVYLELDRETLERRLLHKPLILPIPFDRMYLLRQPIYEKLATHRVSLEGKSEEEAILLLKKLWEAIVSEPFCASPRGESRTVQPSVS